MKDVNEIRSKAHVKFLDAPAKQELIDLSRYSSLQKEKRTMAYILKFVSSVKGELSCSVKGGLTVLGFLAMNFIQANSTVIYFV